MEMYSICGLLYAYDALFCQALLEPALVLVLQSVYFHLETIHIPK